MNENIKKPETIKAADETIKGLVKEGIELYGDSADLNYIDTSDVTNMGELFRNITPFNGDVSRWDVSNVVNMDRMFCDCGSKFNPDLSKWNTSKVTNMSRMFASRKNFNSDLSKWDVSNVVKMNGMFRGCKEFNSDLSKWNVSKVTEMSEMFSWCKNFNSDLSKWDVSKVQSMSDMFSFSKFNGDISQWDVSNVTCMEKMFRRCNNFNSDLSKWDVSNVTNMNFMFEDCINFNSDLSKWDVNNVTKLDYMFRYCLNFNFDVLKWDIPRGERHHLLRTKEMVDKINENRKPKFEATNEFRTAFKAKIVEWKSRYPSVEFVYNSDLDEIDPYKVRYILVGDNPGKAEYDANRYFIGKTGQAGRNFFKNQLEEVNYEKIDDSWLLKHVFFLNKTPIFTEKTIGLKSIDPKIVEETQIWMAEQIAKLHETFIPMENGKEVKLWIIGLSQLRKGKLFESFADKFKKSYKDDIFFENYVNVYKHFSFGCFFKDFQLCIDGLNTHLNNLVENTGLNLEISDIFEKGKYKVTAANVAEFYGDNHDVEEEDDNNATEPTEYPSASDQNDILRTIGGFHAKDIFKTKFKLPLR